MPMHHLPNTQRVLLASPSLDMMNGTTVVGHPKLWFCAVVVVVLQLSLRKAVCGFYWCATGRSGCLLQWCSLVAADLGIKKHGALLAWSCSFSGWLQLSLHMRVDIVAHIANRRWCFPVPTIIVGCVSSSPMVTSTLAEHDIGWYLINFLIQCPKLVSILLYHATFIS